MKKLILLLIVGLISVMGFSQTKTSGYGYLKGSIYIYYDGDGYYPDISTINAVNINTCQTYKTDKISAEDQVKSAKPYKLSVPPGEYYIYQESEINKNYRHYYGKYDYKEETFTKYKVIVSSGITIENINPCHWEINQQKPNNPDCNKNKITPQTSYSKSVNVSDYLYFNKEATDLMYKEINIYREKNGVQPLQSIERLEKYSLQWGDYLMREFMEYQKNDSAVILFHHSKDGPKEYHIPNGVGENIGVAVLFEKPTLEEIITQQMYGTIRGEKTNCYTKSYWHNYNILYPNAKYVGCAVFFAYDEINNRWAVFTVQTFDYQLNR